jgi:hypothetical protein
LLQVALVPVEDAVAGGAVGSEQQIGVGDLGVAAHGLGVQAEPTGNDVDAQALLVQGVDLSMSGPGALHPQSCWCRLGRRDGLGLSGAVGWGRRFGCGLQAAAVVGDGSVHRVGQVVHQMPSVGDLDRVGCAAGGAFGVAAGPISTDNFDAGMRVEPGGQRVGAAVVEDVDHLVSTHIDQDGAVAVAAPPGEVVDAQHCHGGHHRFRQGPGSGAAASSDPRRYRRGWSGGRRPDHHRQRYRFQQAPGQQAVPAVSHGQSVDLLGEDPTDEPARVQKNRRTRSRTSVSRPAIAVSIRCRSYRLCTRRDGVEQPGQRAATLLLSACTRTDEPVLDTLMMRSPDRCGKNTARSSTKDTRHDQPSTSHDHRDRARAASH